MPPPSLLVAVDMESFAALRIEPHLRTAAVCLDLYLFGGHIHVDFEHFPRCYQLKSLLQKFRILHVAVFLPELCKKSHAFILCLAAGRRGTSAQRTNAKDGHLFQRVAKPVQGRIRHKRQPPHLQRVPSVYSVSALSRRSEALGGWA